MVMKMMTMMMMTMIVKLIDILIMNDNVIRRMIFGDNYDVAASR